MSKRFKTGTVARQIGIQPALMRMWETRYGFVRPTRGAGGQRLYSEEDVALLGAACALVSRGYAIGEIASWPRRDLLQTSMTERSILGEGAPPVLAPPELAVADGGEILLAIERDGRIAVVSPSVEPLLGWPHNLLVGQPIWGLVLEIAPAFERMIIGEDVTKAPRVFWLWLRKRDGTVVPCRVASGAARGAAHGTSVTLAITPLSADGTDGLSPLLDNVEHESIMRYVGSTEDLLRDYVTRAVETQGAALARAWIHHPEDGSLRLIASAGLSKSVGTSQRSVIRLARYPFKVGAVARTGIPYIHNGLEDDPDFDRRWITREKLEAAAVLPLVRGGVLLGVTAQFFRRRLSSEDVGRLQAGASACHSLISLPSGPSPTGDPRGRRRSPANRA